MHGIRSKMPTKFGYKNLKETDHLAGLGVDERVELNES
jgi:hypothetical protein